MNIILLALETLTKAQHNVGSRNSAVMPSGRPSHIDNGSIGRSQSTHNNSGAGWRIDTITRTITIHLRNLGSRQIGNARFERLQKIGHFTCFLRIFYATITVRSSTGMLYVTKRGFSSTKDRSMFGHDLSPTNYHVFKCPRRTSPSELKNSM